MLKLLFDWCSALCIVCQLLSVMCGSHIFSWWYYLPIVVPATVATTGWYPGGIVCMALVAVCPREMIEMSVIQLFPRLPWSRSRQFLPDLGGRDFAWRMGLDEGIWEVRETINFSTGGTSVPPITSWLICAAAVHLPAIRGWKQLRLDGGSGPDPSHKWPSMIAVVYPEHFLFSLLNAVGDVCASVFLSPSACCSVPVRCSPTQSVLGITSDIAKLCKTMLSLFVVLFQSNAQCPI